MTGCGVRSMVRRWLLCCLLWCAGGWAVAVEDPGPGFLNEAQLAAIAVDGVSTGYAPSGGLADHPGRVSITGIQVGHCAAYPPITVQAWRPYLDYQVVRANGQQIYLNVDQPVGSIHVPLAFGANAVELLADRYGYSMIYTLNIQRAGPGSNAELAALALSSGTLSPPFDPATQHYSATVTEPSVAVQPTAADCPSLTVNGQPVASGSASTPVPLALGANTLTVQSMAQDGTTRTFSLTITRQASASADLQGLALSSGALSPAFDSAVTGYTAAVPYTAASLSLTLSAAPTAVLTVDGVAVAAGVPHPVALQVGANAIAIHVRSEDGLAAKTYTLQLTRAAADTNARLAALALSAGTLSPAFDPAVAQYTASVAGAVDAVTVTPIPAFAEAVVAVNGTPVAPGGGVRVPLAPGINTITVQATAQDGTTQMAYTLRVVRASQVNSAKLLGLVLSSGTPWPPFHPLTTAYTARAASGAATLTLTPLAEDATATVRVNGSLVVSGEASAPVPLVPGHNAVTLQVTSTDGQQTGSYTLDVLRGQADAALASLSLSDGSLSPGFDPAVLAYSASVPHVMASVRVGLALSDAGATARVAGKALRSGHAAAVALAPGLNTVPVQVTSSDGTVQRSYVLRITRAAPQAVSLAGHPAQFAAPQHLPLGGGEVFALSAQDIDGDGRPDIAALDSTRPDLALLGGQGDGRFGAAQWPPLGVASPGALVLGDFHGQGWLDVLGIGPSQSRLAVGLGGGQLAPHPATVDGTLLSNARPVAHDVDGDGRQDLLASSGPYAVVLRSLGDGSFAPAQTVGALFALKFVVAGDFNADGRADLLLANDQGALRVLHGLAQGGFGVPWEGSLGGLGGVGVSNMVAVPRVADLNGDGRDDVAFAVSVSGVSTAVAMLSQPDGSLGAPMAFAGGEGLMVGVEVPLDLAVGDFNGDGHPDIAVLNGNGVAYTVAILRGLGDGSFAAPQLQRVPWSPRRMALADFDGDGKPDLVFDVPQGRGGGLEVLRNTSADLAQVTLSSGSLSPPFSGDTTGYTVQLPAAGPDLVFTPWLAFGTGVVRVNGALVAHGSAAAPVAVGPGGTATIAVDVQGRDGGTRTYTFTAVRAAPNANAALGALALSAGSLSPVFDPGTLQYTASVAHSMASITLTPTVADPTATVQVNGVAVGSGSASAPIALAVGSNPVTVQVSAQSGATRSYGVNVVRLAVATQFSGSAPGGVVTAGFTGGGSGCGFTASRFVAASSVAPAPPPGVVFPHHLFDFSAEGCAAGGTLHFTVTYPAPLPPGTRYWKYGPTPDNAAPHWYELPATISGSVVRFSITDGGLGDDDFALGPNGTVVDAGGAGAPALVSGAIAVPTLSQWALLLLAMGVAALGWAGRQRVGAPGRP